MRRTLFYAFAALALITFTGCDDEKESDDLNSETQYVDLALPSGTLWCSVDESGYYTFDEAVEKYGEKLPTKAQFQELIDECTWQFDGKKTFKVIGKNDKYITFVGGGYIEEGKHWDDGSWNIWTRTSRGENNAWYFYGDLYEDEDEPEYEMDYIEKEYGHRVRLVQTPVGEK